MQVLNMVFPLSGTMESGVIALVDGPETLSEFHDSMPFDNDAPFSKSERSIEIRNTQKLENGKELYQGRAAKEELTERDSTEINSDGSITASTTIEKDTRYTEFLFVPDEFVAVESSAGTFLFELLTHRTPHTIVSIKFDLDGYLLDNDDAFVWKLGFKERGANAENGVVHGYDLLEDQEVGNILAPTEKNQLGLECSFNSDKIKLFLAESGYVDVYQPSNYDSKDFASLILDELLQYSNPE